MDLNREPLTLGLHCNASLFIIVIISSWHWPKLSFIKKKKKSTTAFPDIPPDAVVWLHVHFPRTFVQCLANQCALINNSESFVKRCREVVFGSTANITLRLFCIFMRPASYLG